MEMSCKSVPKYKCKREKIIFSWNLFTAQRLKKNENFTKNTAGPFNTANFSFTIQQKMVTQASLTLVFML